MVVGGYSLDLYCDGVNCANQGEQGWNDRSKANFAGESFSECAAQARGCGWKISRDKTKCLCPDCVKAGREYSAE